MEVNYLGTYYAYGTYRYFDFAPNQFPIHLHCPIAPSPNYLQSQLYAEYKQLKCSIPQLSSLPLGEYYLDTKRMAESYSKVLTSFKQFLFERKYGWWLGKPNEEKMFK